MASAGFDISRYVPSPHGLRSWSLVAQAVDGIMERRAREKMQREQIAAQQEAQRQAQGFTAQQAAARTAEDERLRIAGIDRENEVNAAKQAGTAIEAEYAGEHGKAQGAIVAGAPYGLARREMPTAAPEASAMPPEQVIRAEVERQQAERLKPAPAPAPAAPGVGWAASMPQQDPPQPVQQQQAFPPQQAAQPQPQPPQGPPPLGRYEYTRGGQPIPGAVVDRDAARQRRVDMTRAQVMGLPESVAIARSQPLTRVAEQARQNALGAAELGPGGPAVTEANRQVDRAARLHRSAQMAKAQAGRFDAVTDRVISRDAYTSVVQENTKRKVAEYTQSRAQLESTLAQVAAGNTTAMAALGMITVRLSQGSAQGVSNVDVASMYGSQMLDYMSKMEDWYERRLDGSKEAPPLGVGELAEYSRAMLDLKAINMQAEFEASMQQIAGIDWPASEIGQHYKKLAVERTVRDYHGAVNAETRTRLQRLEKAKAERGEPSIVETVISQRALGGLEGAEPPARGGAPAPRTQSPAPLTNDGDLDDEDPDAWLDDPRRGLVE